MSKNKIEKDREKFIGMIIMLKTKKKRIGTCYLEFQFCKNDKPIKLGKVDVDIIDNWK